MTNREIDALIAERVMGWIWVRPVIGTKRGDGTIITESMVNAWLEPVDYWDKWKDWISLIKDDGKYPRVISTSIPHYSTNIAVAWQVAEKIEQRFGCHVGVNIVPDELSKFWNGEAWIKARYVVTVSFGKLAYDNPLCTITVRNDTAPMAICLAALKAAESEITESIKDSCP